MLRELRALLLVLTVLLIGAGCLLSPILLAVVIAAGGVAALYLALYRHWAGLE